MIGTNNKKVVRLVTAPIDLMFIVHQKMTLANFLFGNKGLTEVFIVCSIVLYSMSYFSHFANYPISPVAHTTNKSITIKPNHNTAISKFNSYP